MTIANSILDFSVNHPNGFTRKELMVSLTSGIDRVSEASVHISLTRLLKEKKIMRAGYGKYQLTDDFKIEFMYTLDSDQQELHHTIKDKFPFVDFCVWKSTAFTQFTQHVPATDIVFVDVERDAVESVFLYLQSLELGTHIMINPSKTECERYITNSGCIIVRPLLKESPLYNIGGYCVPTLEKLLVDALVDKELEYLHGNELYHIYNNAFSRYNINTKRLLRYASRRNRKDKALSILNNIQS